MAENFKVLFVYPDISKGAAGKFYHGVAYLSAYLKQSGYEVALIHLTEPPSRGSFMKMVKDKGDFDLIAYSATTNMFPVVAEVAGWINDVMCVPSVIGGIHATLAPDEVLATGLFDAVCIGEGEDPLLDLCRRLRKGSSYRDIKNLWVKDSDGTVKNGLRPLRDNLDELPFPDRDIMNYKDLVDMKVLKRGVFMASRGCPYDCTYCCNYSLKNLNSSLSKSYVRFRSVPNIIEEIDRVLSRYPTIENVAFHDDILPLKKNWFYDFCKAYSKAIHRPFQLNCRAELINKDMLQLAKEAGCREVSIGIESGSENIRKVVLNRRMSDAVIIRAFQLSNELGFKTYSYNMVGLPDETFCDMLSTLKLNAYLDVDTVQYSICYPYPGTRLYEECGKKNLLSGETVDSYFESTVLNFGRLRKRQIEVISTHYSKLIRIYRAIISAGRGKGLKVKIFDTFFYLSIAFSVDGFIFNAPSKVKRLFQVIRGRRKH